MSVSTRRDCSRPWADPGAAPEDGRAEGSGRWTRWHDGRVTVFQETGFQERLVPSAGFWAVVPLLGVMVTVSLLPVSGWVAIGGALVVCALAAAALRAASPSIVVTADELQAGPAHVPVALLGPGTSFTGEQARLERGPRLDARAFLVVRGWVGPVVRIPLRDPADPTPYWLVSSRRPDELVAALARARAAQPTENGVPNENGRQEA